MKKLMFLSTASLLAVLAGCVTPNVKPDNTIDPDQSPLQGAVTSQDIRTVASKMCPAILAVPEIARSQPPVRILISSFKNNSRFLFDKNLFAKRLRVELNTFGGGKLRFIDRNMNVQKDRSTMLRQRQEEVVRQNLKQLGKEIAALPLKGKNGKLPKIAVIPVLNTNMVNMNGNSFSAMLRAETAQAAQGKFQFLMPGVIQGADYYLTGQFFPESFKNEGIVNLVNYVEIAENRLKNGLPMDICDGSVPNSRVIYSSGYKQRESELVRVLQDPALRANPNVNKRLNIMLVTPEDKASVFEKMILIDRKIDDNSSKANFILSGEISALSQRRTGVNSDYLLITVQLIEPESNEIIWEGSYETKRLSDSGIVYQ